MRTIFILLGLLLIVGCLGQGTVTVKEIKDSPQKYLGEKVVVKGVVEDSFRLGNLSGFKLFDGEDYLLVSSAMLPPDGKNVTVSGTVMQEVLVGYYILAKDVSLS